MDPWVLRKTSLSTSLAQPELAASPPESKARSQDAAYHYLLERYCAGALRTKSSSPKRANSVLDIVPNPAKVVVVLEELGLPYIGKYLELPELKAEPYLSINPNGRLPGTAPASPLFLLAQEN